MEYIGVIISVVDEVEEAREDAGVISWGELSGGGAAPPLFTMLLGSFGTCVGETAVINIKNVRIWGKYRISIVSGEDRNTVSDKGGSPNRITK